MSQVDSHDTEGLFDLVYEGASDDSARTLQRIKGVFVADLNMSIPDVQRILEHAPSTVTSAESSDELKASYDKLCAAGARVLILRRGGPEDAPHGDTLIQQILSETSDTDQSDADQIEADSEESSPVAEPSPSDEEFSFEFDLHSPETSKPAASAPRAAKVYTLDLDENPSVDEIVRSFDTGSDTPDPASGADADPPAEESEDTPPQNSRTVVLNLLSEEELAEFHLSRGGSLEAPVINVASEEETPSPLVDPSVPLDIAPPDPHLEPLSQSSAAQQRDVAREISLVLEGVAGGATELDPDIQSDAMVDVPEVSSAPRSTLSAPKKSEVPKVAAPPERAAESSGVTLDFDHSDSEDLAAPQPAKTKNAAVAPTPAIESNSGLSLEPLVAEPSSPTPSPVSTPSIATEHEEHSKSTHASGQSPKNTSASGVNTDDEESVEFLTEHESLNPNVRHQESEPERASAPAAASVGVITPRSRSRKRNWSSFEIAIPIVLGSVVLGMGNWLYFSAATPPPPKKLLAVSAAAAAPELPKPTAIPLKIWEPSIQEETRRISARIEKAGNVTILESFRIETPIQRDRTNEEVARGIPLPPWIKRIEAGPLEFRPDAEHTDGTLSASGAALAYIVYAGAPARVPLQLKVSLTPPSEASGFTLQFEGGTAEIPEGVDRTLFSKRNDDGTYVLATEGSMTFGSSLVPETK